MSRLSWTTTRLGLITAAIILLRFPFASSGLASWVRALFWPAEQLVVLARHLGASHPAWFPFAAAIQVVSIAVLIDGVRAWRARPSRESAHRTRNPLAIWDALLLLVVASLGGAYFVLHDQEPVRGLEGERLAFQRERQGQVHDQVAAIEPTAESLVVLLGDSLCLAGLQSDVVLSRRLSRSIGRPIRLATIAVGGMDLVDVSDELYRIESLHPELVLIQANLLFAKVPPDGEIPPRSERWARLLRDRLSGAFTQLGLSLPDRSTREPTRELPNAAPMRQSAAQAGARWRGRRAGSSDPNFRLARSLIPRFRNVGTRVALLRFPVTDRIREEATSFFLERWIETVQLVLQTRLAFLAPEPIWPGEQFEDLVHLNGDGRRRFSRWLVDHLGDCLEGGSGTFDEAARLREYRALPVEQRRTLIQKIAGSGHLELGPFLDEIEAVAEAEQADRLREEIRSAKRKLEGR